MYRQVTLPTADEERDDDHQTRTRRSRSEGRRFASWSKVRQTAGSLAVFEFDVAAGAKVPAAHSHDGYEETIYGLEGVLTWTIEGTPTDVGPGEVVFIPRGAVHRFDNAGDVDATALAIVTPGLLGADYFREIAAVVDAAAGGPPDLAAIGGRDAPPRADPCTACRVR